MIYKTLDGSRVRATHTGGGTEFVTRNASGETISTVWKPRGEADRLIATLAAADALRFFSVFGGGQR